MQPSSTVNGVLTPSNPAAPRVNGTSTLSQTSNGHASSLRPLKRVDVGGIKQELHDALGENGLPYWKALNGYLMGQIGRGEMEGMVRGWLKGSKVELHNKLLRSLLHNASIPTHSITPSSPLNMRKRKRAGYDDPEFDIDPAMIEPKSRVHQWATGILATKERHKIKRGWSRMIQAEQEDPKENEDPTWASRMSSFPMQAGNTMPPLASSAGSLPSSYQLANRLSALGKGYDLHISPDAMGEIGEFLAIGMDAHLSDILHAHVHLTARDRPGHDTIRIPPGHAHGYDSDTDEYPHTGHTRVMNGEMPKPDLDSLRHLITLNPALHSATSPAIYRLTSGITPAEAEYNAPPVKTDSSAALGLGLTVSGAGATGPKERKNDRIMRYHENGMIKLDAAKEEKKDKKHNLHWRYEDPALILDSVLG